MLRILLMTKSARRLGDSSSDGSGCPRSLSARADAVRLARAISRPANSGSAGERLWRVHLPRAKLAESHWRTAVGVAMPLARRTAVRSLPDMTTIGCPSARSSSYA